MHNGQTAPEFPIKQQFFRPNSLQLQVQAQDKNDLFTWIDKLLQGECNPADLLTLDYLVGFDAIDHGILLECLPVQDEMEGTILFSSRGSQKLVFTDCCSSPWSLACGIPQGLVLSPSYLTFR